MVNRQEFTAISKGFLDHKNEKCLGIFPLQRARHFRVVLSWLGWFLIILFPGIFFSAMSSVIITTLPAWKRISPNNDRTSPNWKNDSAIFTYLSDKGSLLVRECDGRVPYDCASCDEGGGPYSREGPTGGRTGGETAGPRPWTRPTTNFSDESISTSRTGLIQEVLSNSYLFTSSSSSSSSSSSISSRRANYTGNPEEICECGVMYKWDECPIVDGGAGCRAMEVITQELYTDLLIWIILGMLFPGTLWLPLFVPLFCMLSKKQRAKRSVTVLIMYILFCVICPAILAYFSSQVINISKRAWDNEIRCESDDQTFAQRGYTKAGIFGTWQAALAGLVFSALTTTLYFFGCFSVLVCPKPSLDSVCAVSPYPQDESTCCCEEDDCGGWFVCSCCECCEAGVDDDFCCSCFNDWDEFDPREYPIPGEDPNDSTNNNANFGFFQELGTTSDNNNIVAGETGINSNNKMPANSVNPQIHPSNQHAFFGLPLSSFPPPPPLEGGSVIVHNPDNSAFPTSTVAPSSYQSTDVVRGNQQQHQRTASMNSDDNPDFFARTNNTNNALPPSEPTGYDYNYSGVAGIPALGRAQNLAM